MAQDNTKPSDDRISFKSLSNIVSLLLTNIAVRVPYKDRCWG